MKKEFSICIPSFNRGYLAYNLIISLLERISEYKNVEVILSNNGSDKEIEWYKKIQSIKNCQLIYYENEENVGLAGNMMKVLLLARSNICLFVSDEDDVITENINKYITYFMEHPTLAYMYAKVENRPPLTTEFENYLFKGYNAEKLFFKDSYLSGMIVNKAILSEKVLFEISEKYGNDEMYKVFPFFYWIGQSALIGDTAYDLENDLIRINKNNAWHDFDTVLVGGQIIVASCFLPEFHIKYSNEIIKFILQLHIDFATKVMMFQNYLQFAYDASIERIDVVKQIKIQYSKDRIGMLTKLKNALVENIISNVKNEEEKNVLCDICKYQYKFIKEKCGRDVYIDSLLYMPSINEFEEYFKKESIKNVAIYGVGYNAEILAVMIYKKIKHISNVLLVDRDAARFELDAGLQGRMKEFDEDFYKLKVYHPQEICSQVDLVIVAVAGNIDEIKLDLGMISKGKIVSLLELAYIIKEANSNILCD